MEDEKTYRIIRFFRDQEDMRQTIARGLTEAQAKAHCNNPESSSRTCTSTEGKELEKKLGPWFDGFEEE